MSLCPLEPTWLYFWAYLCIIFPFLAPAPHVCGTCKLRPCPSYSGRRDRINLGLLRSYDKGGGYMLCISPTVCNNRNMAACAAARTVDGRLGSGVITIAYALHWQRESGWDLSSCSPSGGRLIREPACVVLGWLGGIPSGTTAGVGGSFVCWSMEVKFLLCFEAGDGILGDMDCRLPPTSSRSCPLEVEIGESAGDWYIHNATAAACVSLSRMCSVRFWNWIVALAKGWPKAGPTACASFVLLRRAAVGGCAWWMAVCYRQPSPPAPM